MAKTLHWLCRDASTIFNEITEVVAGTLEPEITKAEFERQRTPRRRAWTHGSFFSAAFITSTT